MPVLALSPTHQVVVDDQNWNQIRAFIDNVPCLKLEYNITFFTNISNDQDLKPIWNFINNLENKNLYKKMETNVGFSSDIANHHRISKL